MGVTERRPTLTDCGCEATVYADGSGIELHYCPMHQAAPQLLEALRNIARGMTNGQLERGETPQSIARAAIQAAGG